jgi:hypothetical protein
MKKPQAITAHFHCHREIEDDREYEGAREHPSGTAG